MKLALSPADALSSCRDKHALLTRLASVVPVPQSELLTEESAARTVAFPRFAKPRLGAGSTGTALIKIAADLHPLPKDGSYLLQELLPGEEYSVDVYLRGDGSAIAAVPRERMKTDSGIAVTARTVHQPDVMEMAIRAAQAASVRYVANVQFKRAADGVFKLLEINPRFPGTLPLTAAAGIDMPKLLIDEMLGRPMPDALLLQEIMVVRYWAEKFVDPAEWQQLCRA